MLISLAGVSGSGKTYSALLLAAGLAGGGKVGFLDTENGRGSMYADSPGIVAALPNGYEIAEMREPFAPSRYTEAVEAFQAHGCKVLVIDSQTHEWEGHGGCSDIAENNKLKGTPNWILAKREHKRMMNHLLASQMHIIFCLRAREKIKVMKDDRGKEQFAPIGLQPIQEKNFTFEMTLSLLLDEHSHRPAVTKCPEPLLHLFQGNQPLITKEMGEKLRIWSEAAPAAKADPELLANKALAYAAQGTVAYQEFWKELSSIHRKELLARHDEFKELARMADDRQKQDDNAGFDPTGGKPAEMMY
ncbi:AAA family ATPase [Zavarzinella formosa]|uniref:AAA family ATPase n=1 Tax=Zavarzinella formosa TaxID=360055 RepID=UPI00036B46F5|nr:AAA family ATPase [Zavarzinella formosa]